MIPHQTTSLRRHVVGSAARKLSRASHSAPRMPSPFQSIPNWRDVGASVNQTSAASLLKERLLYRSAAIDNAAPNDLANRKQLGIKSTVDLRTGFEHATREQRALNDAGSENSVSHFIDLNGDAFKQALMKRLTWPQYIKVIGSAITYQRTAAIRTLASTVMTDRGLGGLAIDTLAASTAEFRSIFTLLADEASYPVHFFCHQGKDRTGLTIMLLLMLLRVPLPAIEADYMASQPELLPNRETRLAELRDMGLPDSFADCDPRTVSMVHDFLKSTHGGVEGYLEGIGVDYSMQTRIKRVLLAADAA